MPPLYAIADSAALQSRRVSDAAAEMAEAGVRWIQLRLKNGSDVDRCREIEATLQRLSGSGVDLWVDDRADLALVFGLRGVHLGQTDLPPEVARRVLGAGPWIGRSTHDDAQVVDADADVAVDLIAVGPVFETVSKHRPDPVVGLDFVQAARRRTRKPLVAIGGIDARNLGRVLDAGADSVAVLGAICRGDIRRNCRRLLSELPGRGGEAT